MENFLNALQEKLNEASLILIVRSILAKAIIKMAGK
jgi:hypothetical protein